MKRTGILNREISALVARLGHLDEVVVCDAGLPVPDGVPVIDLALVPGMVPFGPVLDALQRELVIEGALWAEEAADPLTQQIEATLAGWSRATGQEITAQRLTHDTFKARTTQARAVIRTGEVTPYANVILICGVAF